MSQAPREDTDDLTQDVLVVVIREVPNFKHNGQTGAFRCWLRRITANQLHRYWRAGKGRATAAGEVDFIELANQLEDNQSRLSLAWDREHNEHVLATLLSHVAREFDPSTVQAFRQVTLDGRTVIETAENLGISTAAVYIAKSRVLRRLRHEAAGILD